MRIVSRLALVLLIALTALCTPARAARKSPAPLSSASRLVKFEIVASGPRGEPITDLRGSECQASEDGKHQPFAFFHYDGEKRKQITPAGPGEFSNREGPAAHPTIILLDLLSERLLTWGQAGDELVHALMRMESSRGLYLYVLTNRGALYPVHPLPRNEAELRTANPEWTQRIRPLFEVVTRDLAGFRPMDDHDPAWRAQLTFQAMGQFASYVGAIPGQKNLVWITHGVPRVVPGIDPDNPIDLLPQLQLLGESLARANVALYTVAQSASGAGALISDSSMTLELLSNLTGGRSYSSDSVEKAISEARADSNGSYYAGYRPQHPSGDAKYHKIHVTCMRKGMRLQTRQGYWDFPSQIDQEQAAFEAAADSPFDDPRIGLKATVAPIVEAPGMLRVRIRVDAGDLLLPNPDNHYELALGVVTFSADGKMQNVSTAPVPLSAGQIEQATTSGIEVTRDVTIDTATERLRIVVSDRGSSASGSLTIPIPASLIPPRH